MNPASSFPRFAWGRTSRRSASRPSSEGTQSVLAWVPRRERGNQETEVWRLPPLLIHLCEYGRHGAAGIAVACFVSPADVGIIRIGNGADVFPLGGVARIFQALP